MGFVLILGVVSTVFLLCMLRKSKNDGMKDFICCVCVWCVTCLMFVAWVIGKTQTPDFQYVPAEYIAENSTSTYFGTEDGNIFWIQNEFHYPEHVPYLLGMDTKGTSDVSDDEILTVWRLCE